MTSNTTSQTTMLSSPISDQPWLRAVALLVAGALQTLTFSPFNWWWLGPVSVALILLCCLPLASKQLFRAGWLTGVGLFGTGASWVYISISEHGNTSIPLAVILTVIFVAGLALFHGLAFWGWGKLAKDNTLRRLLLFPAVWILADWVRGWLLTSGRVCTPAGRTRGYLPGDGYRRGHHRLLVAGQKYSLRQCGHRRCYRTAALAYRTGGIDCTMDDA